MTLEKIKKDFVKFIEETRRGDPYPRNFMGCLIAILVESEPVSQERIMDLTGSSQATISLTLQKIQFLFPIKVVKKRSDRKVYYTYDGSPGQLILNLWEKRLELPGIDSELIDKMLGKVKDETDVSAFAQRFLDYLQNMQLYIKLLHEQRSAAIDKFRHVLESGSLRNLDFRNFDAFEQGEFSVFLDTLREKSPAISPKASDDGLARYLDLKVEYFSSVKVNLNPLVSQTVANQLMVIHNVFIEGIITQEEIQEATLLPRSTISEVLSPVVKMGIINVSQKEGSRTKVYQPTISFVDLILSNFDRLVRDVSAGKEKLSEYIQEARRIRPGSADTNKFIETLEAMVNAYMFTQDISKMMKGNMVALLKERYNRGFVFI